MVKLTKIQKGFIQYGFLLFLIFLTTYLVSTTLDIKLIPKIIEIVNTKYIILGIVLVIVYIMLEGVILQLIISSIKNTKIKFIGFKLATMGLYYNLVTPFASGSQPIQIYALTKYKISFSKSVAIITNKTVIFQSIVTIYCGLLVWRNLDLLKTEMPSIMILVTAGMIMNITMLLGGLLIVFSPNKIKILLNHIINLLCKFRVFGFLKNKKTFVNKYIDEYNYSIRIFMKNKKSLFLSLILTVVQLSVFFSIAYCVYKSFGLNKMNYTTLLTLQVFLYMAVSPIPTPGNVGANELAFMSIFANVFPKELIGYAVFLYGVFVYYLIIIISGPFTIRTHYTMGKLDKRKSKNPNYMT